MQTSKITFCHFSQVYTFHFDVYKFWMNTEAEVARQGPRGRRPGDNTNTGIIIQWEIYDNWEGGGREGGREGGEGGRE